MVATRLMGNEHAQLPLTQPDTDPSLEWFRAELSGQLTLILPAPLPTITFGGWRSRGGEQQSSMTMKPSIPPPQP